MKSARESENYIVWYALKGSIVCCFIEQEEVCPSTSGARYGGWGQAIPVPSAEPGGGSTWGPKIATSREVWVNVRKLLNKGVH